MTKMALIMPYVAYRHVTKRHTRRESAWMLHRTFVAGNPGLGRVALAMNDYLKLMPLSLLEATGRLKYQSREASQSSALAVFTRPAGGKAHGLVF